MAKPISATPHEPRFNRVAALIADASRSRMLAYLLAGDCASAGELARAASVSAATASGHLSRLLDEGFVDCEQRGRHRYYRLADGEIAQALSALAMVAERGTHESAWARPERRRLRHARSCYGHLAGELGVTLLQTMLQRDWLRQQGNGFALTETGTKGLQDLGVDDEVLARATRGGRPMAYGCLDWSERRDHLAGHLASTLLQHFTAQHWLKREPGERALAMTPKGKQMLGSLLTFDTATTAKQ